MARSKIHHVSQALVVQTEISARCGVGVRSVQRVLTEPEPRPEDIARGRVGSGRQGRPPEADDAMVERIRLLLESEPTRPRAMSSGRGSSSVSTRCTERTPTPHRALISV